jgi:two-component system response regulator RegA
MTEADRSLLLVDDDLAFCTVLSRALQHRGFAAAHAQGAGAALAQARTRPPAYAVLDIKIGADSGLDLIAPLLALRPQMRIVMLTGYASIPTAVEAIRRGAGNYLCKPVDADMVAAALAEEASSPVAELDELRPLSLRRLEWEHIQRVLAEHDGNISAAARTLGLHRRSLQRRLGKRPVRD